MPTVSELSARLVAVIQENRKDPINQFALEVIEQVKVFLRKEFGAPFPAIRLSLLHGDSYRERLLELGVPERSIEGSSGIYVGNVFSAQILIDLDGVRQFLLEGKVQSAVVFLCNVLIEEFTHALVPKVSDRELCDETIRLVEKFLPDFRFSQEQKKAIHESVSGEPKDGLFVADFRNRKEFG